MRDHLLSLLILLPTAGALIVMFTPRQMAQVIRRVSVGVMLLELLLSLMLLVQIVPGEGLEWIEYGSAFQFVETHVWVESLGISYQVGVDGISLWLIMLTTVLTPVALYGSWGSINTKIKEYAIAFLLLEAAMIGTFVSLDLFLFYVFWELMLVPMYLIIGVWGGPQKIYAAVKFFLYTMVGSLLMLVAILYLVAQYSAASGGEYSFALSELSRVVLPFKAQLICFGAFALAFAIKVPMFPFHTWLPDAHVEAPTGGSVILAAVLLKMGTYGFLRFAMPLFPQASHELGPTMAILALIGILYGAYCAWVQRDVKKLIAYSSVSHLGFVMLGLFSMTQHGLEGAILQMVNHGISTGALFLLVGVIYDRRHTRDIDEFGGLVKVMPWYAVAFVIVTMSSIGLPGTNGFIGEFMILNGSYLSGALRYPGIVTAVAALGVIFAAVYMLHVVLKLFWGPLSNPKNQGLPDLSRREALTLIPLIALVFWIGFFPSTLLEQMQPAVRQFATAYDEKLRFSYAGDELRLLPPAQPLDGAEGEDDDEAAPAEGGAAPEGGAQARVVIPAPAAVAPGGGAP